MKKHNNDFNKVWEAVEEILEYIENEISETYPFMLGINNFDVVNNDFNGEFYLYVIEHSPVLKDLWLFGGFGIQLTQIFENTFEFSLTDVDYNSFSIFVVILVNPENDTITVQEGQTYSNYTKYSDNTLVFALKSLILNIPLEYILDCLEQVVSSGGNQGGGGGDHVKEQGRKVTNEP